ncbi:hypothetical protein [Bradyrhizobium murdochi]|uniref:hypothetical protein n=1 Tax=Bradyrhizobium murdochi TaxID=1038859 RepID=UPI0012EC3313|nr:hypothetical protein [Bradyrhizobium murdochi]
MTKRHPDKAQDIGHIESPTTKTDPCVHEDELILKDRSAWLGTAFPYDAEAREHTPRNQRTEVTRQLKYSGNAAAAPQKSARMSNKAGFANGGGVTPYPKMEHGADRGEGLHEKTKSTATRPSRGNDPGAAYGGRCRRRAAILALPLPIST